MTSSQPRSEAHEAAPSLWRTLEELRRRNVVRLAAAYLVTCWMVVQVVATVGPALAAPPWLLTAVVVLCVIGLAPVLVVSWLYDVTPDGLRRTAAPEALGEDEAKARAGAQARFRRKLGLWTVVAAGCAAALLAVTLVARDRIVAAQPSSLAVLPFADLSPGRDQAYFAEGVAEEILNILGDEPGLRVIGRTSSWQFKDKAADAQAIRKALDVTHVLEGSVRSHEGQVRISVRLLRTSDGAQVWSEEYDRRLQNIFALQDEIGASVAEKLRGTLVRRAEPARRATTSVEVYDQYLAARALIREQELGGLRQAKRLLERAVALDPDYAPAWARLAEATMGLSEHQYTLGDAPLAASRAEALGHLRRALAIDPDLAETHAVLGYVLPPGPEAERALRRAVELDPDLAESWLALSNRLFDVGRVDEGLSALQRAAVIEPLWPPAQEALIGALDDLGRSAEADAAAARYLAAAGDPFVTHRVRALTAANRNQLATMIAHAEQVRRLRPQDRLIRTYEAFALARLGLPDKALAVLPRTEKMSRLVISGDPVGAAAEAVGRGAELWSRKRDARMAGWILLSLGREQDLVALFQSRFPSIAEFRARAEETPYAVPVLVALRRTGRMQEARELESLIRERLKAWGRPEPYVLFHYALVEAAVGNRQAALDGLERAVDGGFLDHWAPPFRDLADYPVFAPYRADPRFRKIRAKFIANAAAQRRLLEQSGDLRTLEATPAAAGGTP